MNDLFRVSYEFYLKKCTTDYLTESELGHEIARLMRQGACDVRVTILDSEKLDISEELKEKLKKERLERKHGS